MHLPIVNLPSRRLSQSAVEPGEPNPYIRMVNLGLIASGLAVSIISYPHRKKGWGYIAGNIGGGMAAIGSAFLFFDIIGARVPEKGAI